MLFCAFEMKLTSKIMLMDFVATFHIKVAAFVRQFVNKFMLSIVVVSLTNICMRLLCSFFFYLSGILKHKKHF